MAVPSRWSYRLVVSGVAALLLVAATVGVAVALTRVPRFYIALGGMSEAQLLEESRQFRRRSTSVINQIENERTWTGSFSDTQINAWLAGEFELKHAAILPDGVSDPRVCFESGRASVAFRKAFGPTGAVLWATGRLWLPETNLIALEIEQVRAGVVPLPSTLVIDTLSSAAKSANLAIEWKQHDGNPVALLRIGQTNKQGLDLSRIEIDAGVLHVGGRSRGKGTSSQHVVDSLGLGVEDVSWNDQPKEGRLQR